MFLPDLKNGICRERVLIKDLVSSFTDIHAVGAALMDVQKGKQTDRQSRRTEGRTSMKEVIVAFRDFS
jgi:hypothetical protein